MLARTLVLFAACNGLALSQAAPPQSALAVIGDISSQLHLKAEDLARMPRQTVSVKEKDGNSAQYEGVPLREIMSRAGAPLGKELRGKALATYVLAKGRDGYEALFALPEVDAAFANETILIADKRNGEPLPASQEPFRLVCPNDQAGARSVRMLETLEVVRLRK